jgi:hypothetical protein
MLTACKNQGCVHAAPTLALFGLGPAGQTAAQAATAIVSRTALELIHTPSSAERSS